MVLQTTISDKHTLISFLENNLNEKASYSGPPLFQYRIGDYTVLRNGDLDVTDGMDILHRKLEKACLINPVTTIQNKDIVVALEDFQSGKGYANIVRILHSRGKLINQCIGQTKHVYVSKRVMKTFQKYNPLNYDDFLETLAYAGGVQSVKGVRFSKDMIIFTGLSDDKDPDMQTAYRILADHIVKAAFTKQWTRPYSKSTDERYLCRMWLNTLGIPSDTRAILLKNFNQKGDRQ